MTDEQSQSSTSADAPPRPVARPRPRRALGAPGELPPEVLDRHARTLRGMPLEEETQAQRAVREGRRQDLNAALDTLRGDAEPAQQRPRHDLSEILDRLGSPDLARFTDPLVGTVERLLPSEPSPERAASARRRRAEAGERRRAEREQARRHANDVARRRAKEEARRAHEAAARAAALQSTDAIALEAERAAEVARLEKEQRRQTRLRVRRTESLAAAEERAVREAEAREEERRAELRAAQEESVARDRAAAARQEQLQAETQARREQAEEKERRRRAAQLARRRRQEHRLRERQDAERRRREAAERKERRAREEAHRRERERERRQHEALVAATRARVQAERRAREEAELAARERARAAAEAERRRIEAEAEAERLRKEAEAEAERRRQEEERRRQEAEEAAAAARAAEEAERAAAEAERERRRRARRFAATVAGVGLAHARRVEDRRLALAARRTEEQQQEVRAHWARESRALLQVAREIEGPELIPAPQDRPLLSQPGEDVSDAELLARARVALPEWRRRGRLATKASAVQAMTAAGAPGHGASSGSAGSSPTTGPLPLIPGYTPPQGEPEPRRPATFGDRRRQLLLTAAVGLFLASSAWGLGLAGRVPGLGALDLGSYRAAHDGRYGADTTIFSLFAVHVLVWPGLWLVLGLHVLHQWMPGQAAASRQRETGRLTAQALVALALWFPIALLVPWGLDWVVWLTALALLVRVIRRLTDLPARSRRTALFQDGALGILLGVLLAGAPTTLAAALAAWGVHVGGFPTELLAVLLMLAVLVAAARLVLTDRGRMGIALGMSWTLLCLAIPRLLPSPLGSHQSAWVGFLAVFGGLGLIVVAAARRSWVRQLERGALTAG